MSKRLKNYFNISFLENEIKKNKSIIYRALLKYGYSQFSLEILEYCEPGNCVEREQYYLDLLPHEYNILPNAGSRLGSRHTEETRAKQAAGMMGEKNSMYGKKRIHSEETRAKQAAGVKGEKNPRYGKARADGAGSPSQRIEVLDILTNSVTQYDSISAAGLALGIKSTTISTFIGRDQKKAYKDSYIFKKI
jgi:group I intron endonuclease